MRQAGGLAEAAGAPPPLVAAALLHDVGHLRGETDARHGPAGAQWLGQWFGPGARGRGGGLRGGKPAPGPARAAAQWWAQCFGPAVTEPVRLHVAAKRYL